MLIEVFSGMFLNFGLLAALLVTPCLLLMAYWYRKQLPQTLLIWKKPELVIITITFSVMALVLFIVGISSFFTYFGYLRSAQIDPSSQDQFYTIGVACFLLAVSLFFFYLTIRTLLVQIITEQGIVNNDRFFRIPDFRNITRWHQIVDYYIKSDYPNVVFTLIIQDKSMKFHRMVMLVPVYQRDSFEKLLEKKLNDANLKQARNSFRTSRFSEN
jgi:hypothetical protein